MVWRNGWSLVEMRSWKLGRNMDMTDCMIEHGSGPSANRPVSSQKFIGLRYALPIDLP
jgi:hypothetical protein